MIVLVWGGGGVQTLVRSYEVRACPTVSLEKDGAASGAGVLSEPLSTVMEDAQGESEVSNEKSNLPRFLRPNS